jgi:genome maintenance exonuclease 1
MTFNYCPPKQIEDLQSVTQPDGRRFYTLPNGSQVPSITTVLGALKKKAIMEWRDRVGHEEANRISRKASSRGTNVHRICELYLLNEEDHTKKAMPDALEMFLSLKPELNKINNIHYQEQALWSTQLGLAGRVDCIAEYDGELSVIDFKTSRYIKERDSILDYFQQTTAYALMYEELVGTPINNVIILMAVEGEKTPLVFKEKTEDHIEGLVSAIEFYKKTIT